MQQRIIKTKEEARQYTIEWQNWASKTPMSYGELAEWQLYFTDLVDRFDLKEEFEENGII